MKFSSFYAVALMATALLTTGATLVSCEDDEETPPVKPVLNDPSSKIAGVYSTDFDGKVIGIDLFHLKNQKLEVKRIADSLVSVRVSAYETDITNPQSPYGHVAVGEYTIDSVKIVAANDTVVKFEKEATITIPHKMVHLGGVAAATPFKDYSTQLGITGEVKGENINVTIGAMAGRMPFPLIYTYKGKR